SGMGVDKAFVYFFNDKDEPSLHAASGLTRNYEPKPAYHAVAWMLDRLRNYRFHRIVKASAEEGYVYEFESANPDEPRVLAVWRATGEGPVALPEAGGYTKAERMPLAAGGGEAVDLKADAARISVGGRPVLVWRGGK
ncbi:MAG: hypothetical protein JWL81_3485, partial [Verrucomicrobiales bacterium]|nr:hypothetical protein [Verrucomicrobiales bacterium]